MTATPNKPGAAAPAGHDPSAVATAEVLIEALPFIREFWGRTIVVKYGGNAMTDPGLAQSFAADIVLLHSVGIRVVVVHGGGPQIGDLLGRLGMESEFRDGLRVTDAETLDVARMVLVGKVNRDIVASINVHGPLAVGLSGEDGGLITANLRDPELGFVGDVAEVNPALVESLLAENLIPVVSTIGADIHGQSYNINADTVAGAIGGALGAAKVVYLTDIAGLLRDVDDPTSLIASTTPTEIAGLIDAGVLSGGMIPKVEACLEAVDAGVPAVHMLDGRVPHVVLLELFTRTGVGTMITPDHDSGSESA